VAEWARLLSECWVKPVAGSNPALPATQNAFREERVFVLNFQRVKSLLAFDDEWSRWTMELFEAQLHPQM
jgi:hypothetical protein